MNTRMNKRFVWLGIGWTVLFAGMSFYWAAGGMLGVRSLGGSIYEQALNPDPSFVAVVWLSGWIKLLGAVLLFMMFVDWNSTRMRMLVYYAAKLGGAGLFLYGMLNFITISLHAAGVLSFDLDRYATLWRLLFWEPYWMIGGVLYFFSIRRYKHPSAA